MRRSPPDEQHTPAPAERAPTPDGRAEQGARRRSGPLVGAIAILLAGGLFAAFTLLNRPAGEDPAATASGLPSASPPVDHTAEVEAAYLAYWKAREEAYLRLDLAPLEPVTTPTRWSRSASSWRSRGARGGRPE